MKPLKTYCPFGPPIGHAKLPKEMIYDLNKGCDDIIKDEELAKERDWSQTLVGQVEQELTIPVEILNKWGNWFVDQIKAYMHGYFEEVYVPQQTLITSDKSKVFQNMDKIKVDVLAGWYVRSFAGDYNPIHTHTACQLTCVGYLKVPDLTKERTKSGSNLKEKNYTPGGNLEILSSLGTSVSPFENDRISFIPKVGNWYLFPASIRHGVYPFTVDGERRSFSINMNTNMFKRSDIKPF
jgi:hypothetical protein